jgi:hypothetical protein
MKAYYSEKLYLIPLSETMRKSTANSEKLFMNSVIGICQIFTRIGETLFNLYKNSRQIIMMNPKISTVVIFVYYIKLILLMFSLRQYVNMHLFILLFIIYLFNLKMVKIREIMLKQNIRRIFFCT